MCLGQMEDLGSGDRFGRCPTPRKRRPMLIRGRCESKGILTGAGSELSGDMEVSTYGVPRSSASVRCCKCLQRAATWNSEGW